jgi:glycosyltransferase involved in cell wall biosynthesis
MDRDVHFSVIVPTAGRRTLLGTLESIVSQLEPGDEVIVLRDGARDYGHSARNSAMPRAKGTHLLFQDDDDQYANGAIAEMRRFAREQPDRIGIFRMRYPDGRLLWADPELRYKNVSTQTFLIPNVPGKLGRWENDGLRDGDYVFIEKTVALQGDPVFCDHVVTYVRSDRRPVRRRMQRLLAPLSRLRFRAAPRTRLWRALGRLP